MKLLDQRINDFITLFNIFWYRDFPLSENYKTLSSRAEWTTHIGICVRSTADLLGLFTYFESGVRTDAIIRDNEGYDIVHIEWEWTQPVRLEVNEVKKLYSQRKTSQFSVFISYSLRNLHDENLNSIRKQWRNSSEPLLLFLITFDFANNRRWFYDLETYLLSKGKMKKVRRQPALPWEVAGTRWESNRQMLADKLLDNDALE